MEEWLLFAKDVLILAVADIKSVQVHAGGERVPPGLVACPGCGGQERGESKGD